MKKLSPIDAQIAISLVHFCGLNALATFWYIEAGYVLSNQCADRYLIVGNFF